MGLLVPKTSRNRTQRYENQDRGVATVTLSELRTSDRLTWLWPPRVRRFRRRRRCRRRCRSCRTRKTADWAFDFFGSSVLIWKWKSLFREAWFGDFGKLGCCCQLHKRSSILVKRAGLRTAKKILDGRIVGWRTAIFLTHFLSKWSTWRSNSYRPNHFFRQWPKALQLRENYENQKDPRFTHQSDNLFISIASA